MESTQGRISATNLYAPAAWMPSLGTLNIEVNRARRVLELSSLSPLDGRCVWCVGVCMSVLSVAEVSVIRLLNTT